MTKKKPSRTSQYLSELIKEYAGSNRKHRIALIEDIDDLCCEELENKQHHKQRFKGDI